MTLFDEVAFYTTIDFSVGEIDFLIPYLDFKLLEVENLLKDLTRQKEGPYPLTSEQEFLLKYSSNQFEMIKALRKKFDVEGYAR
ncbi:hypothetical protein AB4E09_19720 [Clostridioides difficile]|nr:hypothetical protein [Clostridioides difficile]MBY2541728.1 hypothetical protein [Clostridioides difficile]MDV5911823.1 hypothetical protein [Clostridioides difficile]CZR82694.1 hypothetical protein CDFC105_53650 [Clostridioides difficile]